MRRNWGDGDTCRVTVGAADKAPAGNDQFVNGGSCVMRRKGVVHMKLVKFRP